MKCSYHCCLSNPFSPTGTVLWCSWSVGDGWVSCIRETTKFFPSFCSCLHWKQHIDRLWLGCAKLQHSFRESCTETIGWNKIAALRILKGNAFHSPISFKAINIGMTWSLFINPQCRRLGTAGQKQGALFALMVITCSPGREGGGWGGHGPFQCQWLHHSHVLVTLQQITVSIRKGKHHIKHRCEKQFWAVYAVCRQKVVLEAKN